MTRFLVLRSIAVVSDGRSQVGQLHAVNKQPNNELTLNLDCNAHAWQSIPLRISAGPLVEEEPTASTGEHVVRIVLRTYERGKDKLPIYKQNLGVACLAQPSCRFLSRLHDTT
jgi:hypothetical protein